MMDEMNRTRNMHSCLNAYATVSPRLAAITYMYTLYEDYRVHIDMYTCIYVYIRHGFTEARSHYVYTYIIS